METLLIILFGTSCLIGAVRPSWAVAMIFLIFPIQQLLQAGAPSLMGTSLQHQIVNYSIGVVSLMSAIVVALRTERPMMGLFNPITLAITAVLVWAVFSLLWSLDRMNGLIFTAAGWPYYFLRILLATFLLTRVRDLEGVWRDLMLLGSLLCILILINPRFVSQWGRLGIVEGGKMNSNPLALGSMGGMLLISGALLRKHSRGVITNVVRIAAIGFGLVMLVQSGARGQVFLASLVTLVFFPIATPLRDFKSFALTAVGLIILAVAVPLIVTSLLEGFAAKRFSADELLYGSSSANERWNNLSLLFNAWSRSPTAPFIGLGYFSFFPIGAGAIYSHVIVADFIFELGIPGIFCLVWMAIATTKACVRLIGGQAFDPVLRCASAVLVAIIAFEFLVANKQGDLWGSTTLFMFMAIAGRLESRARNLEFDHGDSCDMMQQVEPGQLEPEI